MQIFVHAHICSCNVHDRKEDEVNRKDRVVHPEHPMDPPSTVPSTGGLMMLLLVVLLASIQKEMTA